jgi:hypothetical protein
MAISRRLRFEILRRDNHQCRYCGATSGDAKLTVDHVVPTALGGSDEPANLVTACQPCNAGKAASSPTEVIVEDVSGKALRWARAMKVAAAAKAEERQAIYDYCKAFHDEWKEYGGRLPSNWANTLEAMYAAGLPQEVALDSVGIAMTAWSVSDRFRYFCGVAWRRVAEIQDAAKAILDAEGDG